MAHLDTVLEAHKRDKNTITWQQSSILLDGENPYVTSFCIDQDDQVNICLWHKGQNQQFRITMDQAQECGLINLQALKPFLKENKK